MNTGKICISICGESADQALRGIRDAECIADVIEIRFDCLEPSQLESLIGHLNSVNKPLLFTFRPREQGGKRELTRRERVKFWEDILPRVGSPDIRVDHEHDLEVSVAGNNAVKMVSWHDFGSAPDKVNEKFQALTLLDGEIIKVAVSADDAADALQVWKLLESANKPVVPIAMGEAGKWTRILGLAHGAPLTYASLATGGETAPGQISGADLRDVFRAKELDRSTNVYGVIAGNTSYSLSTYMHNAAFRQMGMNSVFIPLQVRDLGEFARRMVKRDTREVELNFRGFSVTNPHKQAIMKYLDFVDDTAQKIGAVNTVNVQDGKLYGYNTDAPGFIEPLRSLYGDLRDARVAVAGAGGAARACVYALQQEGATVTVLVRDLDKGVAFAEEFGIEARAFAAGHKLTTDILVNATPLGTRGDGENETIATANELRDVKLVYDLVYNPTETRLLREARLAGAKTSGGIDMLVAQGARQFLIWTGQAAPVDVMKAAITERLSKTNAA
jgi:3-dehydroquinate dehydratase/shikimate dehydrogenase